MCVWFFCAQALYTYLRFLESWFRAENSSDFERVSNSSFCLLGRDAAGHILKYFSKVFFQNTFLFKGMHF